ncbi:hypothetical protein HZA39_03125 [Candidatus Peregrinibacteria bacterium]|nr:hypothetical protein [Candidatus Peregrinibacteria bacterium]
MKKFVSLVIIAALSVSLIGTAFAQEQQNSGADPAQKPANACAVCVEQFKAAKEAHAELMKLIFSADATKDQIADAAEKFINSRKALKTCADEIENTAKQCRLLRGRKLGWMRMFGGPKWFWFK